MPEHEKNFLNRERRAMATKAEKEKESGMATITKGKIDSDRRNAWTSDLAIRLQIGHTDIK